MKVLQIKRKARVVINQIDKVHLIWEDKGTICPFEDGDVVEVVFTRIEKSEESE